MKSERIPSQRRAGLVLALLLGPFAAQADEVVMFGITNRSINGASVSVSESGGFHVDGLSAFGYKGVSVLLGEADSGLFFSPQLGQTPNNGNFMAAHAFGRLHGIPGPMDWPISSVFGRRDGYGIYPVLVDFTPLGSFSQTLQVYCGNDLVREESNTLGTVTFRTDSAGHLNPRVNPCWRAPDGSVGVLIEFNSSYVSLPHSEAYGDRVFIKPVNPLLSVDAATRVDIFGGGGLPGFEGAGEALGVFGHAHTALGTAVLTARPGSLTAGELGPGGEDGVMAELDGASACEMQLVPFALPTNGSVEISAAGIGDSHTFRGRNFIGPVRLLNAGGTVEVSGLFGNSPTNRVRLEMYRDGEHVGSGTNLSGLWGTIPSGDWQVLSCGARPDAGDDHSSVYVKLDQTVAFQRASGGDPLAGNELRFSWLEPGPDNGSFRNFQLQVGGVSSFTITNAVFAPPPLPQLAIVQSSNQIAISWPYGNHYNYLESGHEVNGVTSYQYTPGAQLVGSRWQVTVPVTSTNQQFFRLFDWCKAVNNSLNAD